MLRQSFVGVGERKNKTTGRKIPASILSFSIKSKGKYLDSDYALGKEVC
jgi:hypothetical protein